MAILKSVTLLTVCLLVTSTVSSDITFRNLPFRNHNTRIVNGFQATPGQFPHQALLEITLPQGSAVCGGSLLNNEWVTKFLGKYLEKHFSLEQQFLSDKFLQIFSVVIQFSFPYFPIKTHLFNVGPQPKSTELIC